MFENEICRPSDFMLPLASTYSSLHKNEHCLNYANNTSNLIREHAYDKAYLKEALIKTYPLEFALKRYHEICKQTVDAQLQNISALEMNPRCDDKDAKIIDLVDSSAVDEDGIASLFTVYFPFA